jgi:hypothetical protein
MADIRFSDLTAAAVSDVTAATSIVPISIPGGAAPISRKLTFATLVTWLATVGMIATVITAGGFSSTAGMVSLGAAPPTTAAINVDASGYATTAFATVNGTATTVWNQLTNGVRFGTTSASHSIFFQTGNTDRWQLSSISATSEMIASQGTARIVGGATNGLAIRNSANTRDNFSISDSGAIVQMLDSGGGSGSIVTQNASGEAVGGIGLAPVTAALSTFLATLTSGTSSTIQGRYYDGTVRRSAWEITNVASGFGTLDLMKSGGIVRIGNNAGNTANALTIDGTAFGAGAASLRLNGLTNGAGASAGTLTNAPSVGNPNFWIPINVAGTVRYVPAW